MFSAFAPPFFHRVILRIEPRKKVSSLIKVFYLVPQTPPLPIHFGVLNIEKMARNQKMRFFYGLNAYFCPKFKKGHCLEVWKQFWTDIWWNSVTTAHQQGRNLPFKGTGGGVFGQFFDFLIFQSPQYGGLRTFYRIKKAFSVDEICFVKDGTYAHFFGVFPAFV